MAKKRFTDTEIWNDPWYRKLSSDEKVLWGYLKDRCDPAGFWKKDFEMASFQCGFEVGEGHLEGLNKGKLRVKDCGTHLQIVDFIPFQFGELSAKCNPHKPILALVDVYKKKGYLKDSPTLEEEDKEKDKEIRGSVRGKFKPPTVGEVRAYCVAEGLKVDAQQIVDFYDSKGWVVGKSPMKNWQAAVRGWARRNGQSPAPPRKCKDCGRVPIGGHVQATGGIICTDCNNSPRSNRYQEMRDKAIKTI